MLDRRAEGRWMCADLVRTRIGSGVNKTKEVVANLEDISLSGACVQLEAAVRKGAAIEIVCANCRLKGKVRYCRFDQTGYFVGVQFRSGQAWDRRLFEPKHLLDIAPVAKAGRSDATRASAGPPKGD